VPSVPITTNVISSNPVYGDVYSIQHYVIKFVSDLRQVGGFLCQEAKKQTRQTRTLLQLELILLDFKVTSEIE
jgi:hypothetical protein